MAARVVFCKCFVLLMNVYFVCVKSQNLAVNGAVIRGVRAESTERSEVIDGMLVIEVDNWIDLRFIGDGFSENTSISFTATGKERNSGCDDLSRTSAFSFNTSTLTDTSAVARVKLERHRFSLDAVIYVCVREVQIVPDKNGTESVYVRWIHQGSDPWIVFKLKPAYAETTLLPVPVQIIVLIVLLGLSGMFSGLNLGLMALDKTELAIVENCGSETEKQYAKKIRPVRANGNYLLCTLLLGNVLVNSTLTILLDDLTSGLIAVIGSTFAIVIFGEIVPQAICCRHGLAVGAHTLWLTKAFMVLTGPLSYPISKLLDVLLGDEIGVVYNRTKLLELLKVTHEHHDIENEEVRIISGALHLTTKTVKDQGTGYTRVPIYDGDRTNIVAILNIKDLAFVDPDDNTPLQTVCKFYQHPIANVFGDTSLALMLDEFKKGNYHIAFVQEVVEEDDKDNRYGTLGLVTLEDIIEEIIQEEILDETDVISDNVMKKPRAAQVRQDFMGFARHQAACNPNKPVMSPQLQLATFQFLSTSIEPFKKDFISETVLQRLLRQDIFKDVKLKDAREKDVQIYTAGKMADYFILILEGRVQVSVGKENLVFESGPFSYYGVQALHDIAHPKSVVFTPDYSVHLVTDCQLVLIKRSQYWAARRTTLMEMEHRIESSEDFFTMEWTSAEKASMKDQSLIADAETSSATLGDDVAARTPAASNADAESSSRDADGPSSPEMDRLLGPTDPNHV
ncbi:PREDICTED: metal transporter CNNM4-like [Priapulus caudatus]|uniref:Metal transporter CNNM4-like n=1 Tax=Priapulus caudatus TaxID=37621 RepID=A0ABM1E1A0_PRICU|nr:PREDICTED: metal transporter CNNM4-like [Priapulus caudatus]